METTGAIHRHQGSHQQNNHFGLGVFDGVAPGIAEAGSASSRR